MSWRSSDKGFFFDKTRASFHQCDFFRNLRVWAIPEELEDATRYPQNAALNELGARWATSQTALYSGRVLRPTARSPVELAAQGGAPWN